ncbi:hypothetical protein CEP53_008696 [Fusarium sp. AF-6]|nr:hypothetical protein CEP53_008696 [Fusarium sp. AF-6]
MAAPDTAVETQPVPGQAQQKKISGWRFTLITGAASVVIMFIINLSITFWAIKLPVGNETKDTITSRRIIFEGSCVTSKNLNAVLHLLINIFSSVLLSASSYAMQCLSAPTRAEVDQAHAQGQWMDVGLLSVRNLGKISGKRCFLWVLLALSSLPMHLLYNSVVFASLSTTSYFAVVIDESGRWNASAVVTKGDSEMEVGKSFQFALRYNWENLTTLQCIDAYATGFQTTRSHVILVCDKGSGIYDSDLVSTSDNLWRNHCRPSPFDWICGASVEGCSACRNQLAAVRNKANDWRPAGCRVKYCLSKPVRQACRLNFSMVIATIMLGTNILKAGILVYVALTPPKQPLFVLGDAIQTFLEIPEPASKNMTLASIDYIKRSGFGRCSGPMTPSLKRRQWAAAVSSRRWATSVFLYCLALGATLFFLSCGIHHIIGDRDIQALWKIGFGEVSETAILTGMGFKDFRTPDNQVLISVFFANLPHILFSILYFQYNGLFTSMVSSNEWSAFGQKRKAIRVSSHPRGEQRSRYFLQLPYRFGIPLTILSILMHWMLSQSIFIVVVEDMQGSSPDSDPTDWEWIFATCGYSPIAIIFAIFVSVLMAAWVAITGWLKLPTAIPVVGSCSLAIAAACHHPNGLPQPEAPLIPLQWGVMRRPESRDGSGYGHCGLSSEEVGELQDGEQYL